jgi:hypothetical protein
MEFCVGPTSNAYYFMDNGEVVYHIIWPKWIGYWRQHSGVWRGLFLVHLDSRKQWPFRSLAIQMFHRPSLGYSVCKVPVSTVISLGVTNALNLPPLKTRMLRQKRSAWRFTQNWARSQPFVVQNKLPRGSTASSRLGHKQVPILSNLVDMWQLYSAVKARNATLHSIDLMTVNTGDVLVASALTGGDENVAPAPTRLNPFKII